MICLATAHSAKFPDAIRKALGRDSAHHPALDALAGKPVRCQVLPASPEAIRSYLETNIPGKD
jgi:threonine synthase